VLVLEGNEKWEKKEATKMTVMPLMKVLVSAEALE